MNRRKFIRATALGVVTLATAKFARMAAAPTSEHFIAGRHEPPQGYTVFLDGLNIHRCCRECHTGEGWADCFPCKRDAAGNIVELLDPPDAGWAKWEKIPGGWAKSGPVNLHRRLYGKVELRKVA